LEFDQVEDGDDRTKRDGDERSGSRRDARHPCPGHRASDALNNKASRNQGWE
jgi:hypothetical protein